MSCTGGDYEQTESFSDTAGDSMSVTFTGTAVQWIAPTATNHGIADVYLDGQQVATADGYSPGTEFQQVEYSVSGLANTSHTLKIVVSGQKNPASAARRRVIVADGSKLGEVELAKVCDIDEVSLVISDHTADPAVVSEIEAAGCTVELAP